MTMKQEVVRFLQKSGVETRFVSIVDEKVYVNNLKLSRFSRKKEEIFLEEFTNFEVRRSKVFQKICSRASRVLKNSLSPHDKIILSNPSNCANLALYTVLEPYTRKYGVELLLQADDVGRWNELKIQEKKSELSMDSMALPLTLDGEVEHILENMLKGENLDILSAHSKKNGIKMIYPLSNVPISWIESWADIEDLNCNFEPNAGLPRDMLEFLEGFIPDVREKMMSSAFYLSGDK